MELSVEKKKELLMFWFNYYGKVMYTLEELDIFHNLVETNLEGVEKVAVVNFIKNLGSSIFVLAIRDGKELELLNTLDFSDAEEDPTNSDEFRNVTDEFYSTVMIAFGNRLPNVPLKKEEMIIQINDIQKKLKNKNQSFKN